MNQNTMWLMITGAILVGGGVYRRLNPHLAEMPEQQKSKSGKRVTHTSVKESDVVMKVLVPKEGYGGTEEDAALFMARMTQFASMNPPVSFRWKIVRTDDPEQEYRFFMGIPEGVGEDVLRNLPEGTEAHEPPEGWTEPSARFRTIHVGLRDHLFPIARGFGKLDPLLTILRAMPKPSEVVLTFSPLTKSAVMTDLKKLHKTLDPKLRAIEQAESGSDTNAEIWQKRLDKAGHVAGVASREFLGFLAEATGVKEIEHLGKFPDSKSKKTATNKTSKTSVPKLLPDEEARLKAIQTRYADAGTMFECTLQLRVPEGNATHGDAQGIMGALIDFRGETEFAIKRTSDLFWLSAEELSGIAHVPSVKSCPTQVWIRDNTFALKDDQFTEGVAIGRLIHPMNPSRMVYIPTTTFLQHFGLFGKNGSGKSSILLMMIMSLLYGWVGKPAGSAPGLSFIDPKQETALNVINRLAWLETQGYPVDWDRVHYLSFGEGFPFDVPNDYPVGINLLDRTAIKDSSDVAEAVQELLHAAYPGDTVFTDKLIKNGIRTLLEDDRDHNLMALSYLYDYPDFQKTIPIEDLIVRKFWRTTGEILKPSQLEPMMNRMETLIGNKRTRRIFGQMRSPLQIRKWMDEGHIVLIDALNVSRANTKILMGYLLNQYYFLAKTRTPNGSLAHMLVIDEAHNVQTPIIEKIMAETRAFGLSCGISTQFPEQLRSEIYNAISENAGTVISCGVGPISAGQIASIMNKRFSPEMLQGLAERESCVYTKVSGMGELAFKVKADPPITYLPNGKAATYKTPEIGEAQRWAIQKIVELQQRDFVHRDEVDRQIDGYLRWLESFAPKEEGESDGAVTGVPQQAKVSESVQEKDYYVPTDEESLVLHALIDMVNEEGTWSGSVSDMIEDLGLESSRWSSQRLGISLGRAKSWLNNQRIGVEYTTPRGRSHWKFWLE